MTSELSPPPQVCCESPPATDPTVNPGPWLRQLLFLMWLPSRSFASSAPSDWRQPVQRAGSVFREDKGPLKIAPLWHLSRRGGSTDHSWTETQLLTVVGCQSRKEKAVLSPLSPQFYAFSPRELSSCCLGTVTVFLTTKATLQAVYKHVYTHLARIIYPFPKEEHGSWLQQHTRTR